MYVIKRRSDYELKHADFKYTGKEFINGKWRYYYEDSGSGSNKSTNTTTTSNKATTNTTNTNSSTSTSNKHDAVVKEILAGKWGNGKERWDKLSKAGYNWAEVQNAVNEKLGNSFRHLVNQKDSISKAVNDSKKKTVSSMKKETKTGKKVVNNLLK